MAETSVTIQDLREFFTKRNPNPQRAVTERDITAVFGEFVTWIEGGKQEFVAPLSVTQRAALMGAKQAGIELTPDQERQLQAPSTPKGFA